MTEDFSVHDQPDFARVYDEDDLISVRRGDIRALLDIATSSLDFGSGFLDNEQVEVLRKVAAIVGVDPTLVTPSNFVAQYVCAVKGHTARVPSDKSCYLCGESLSRSAPESEKRTQ